MTGKRERMSDKEIDDGSIGSKGRFPLSLWLCFFVLFAPLKEKQKGRGMVRMLSHGLREWLRFPFGPFSSSLSLHLHFSPEFLSGSVCLEFVQSLSLFNSILCLQCMPSKQLKRWWRAMKEQRGKYNRRRQEEKDKKESLGESCRNFSSRKRKEMMANQNKDCGWRRRSKDGEVLIAVHKTLSPVDGGWGRGKKMKEERKTTEGVCMFGNSPWRWRAMPLLEDDFSYTFFLSLSSSQLK